MTDSRSPSPRKLSSAMPSALTAVAMQDESGCSRCPRRILVLEKAFLDEGYAAVCAHCAADAYRLSMVSRHLRPPIDPARAEVGPLGTRAPWWGWFGLGMAVMAFWIEVVL